MATDPNTQIVHPGDVIQDSDGLFLLVTETRSWGVGAVERWREGPVPYEIKEHYHRMKPGTFWVVGPAHLIPEEVAQARRDSLALARDIERDQRK